MELDLLSQLAQMQEVLRGSQQQNAALTEQTQRTQAATIAAFADLAAAIRELAHAIDHAAHTHSET